MVSLLQLVRFNILVSSHIIASIWKYYNIVPLKVWHGKCHYRTFFMNTILSISMLIVNAQIFIRHFLTLYLMYITISIQISTILLYIVSWIVQLFFLVVWLIILALKYLEDSWGNSTRFAYHDQNIILWWN